MYRRSALILVSLMLATAAGCSSEKPTILNASPTAGPPSTQAPPTTEPPSTVDGDCEGLATKVTATGSSFTVTVKVHVCTPAGSGTQYWVVVKNDAARYYPKGRVKGDADDTFTARLGPDTDKGSKRVFFVAKVPAAAVATMKDLLAHDNDGDRDGQRGALPDGVEAVSNEVTSTFTG